ncbi:chemotaxis protein CheB [Motilibacter aurantiacus]|uniref:chemotaxis protein CheB n=1 Tax=Motilibacter aurantiacus TaxID=2714955 RepID=UPI002F2B7AAC
MAQRDIITVAASAGGLEPLRALVAGLPPDLPASVLVVLHVPAHGVSALPAILDPAGPLPAGTAVDGEPLGRGRVHVAPPDHHVLVLDGHVTLSRGPRENGHRPAADPLFRSAALARGPGVVGVVLSGALDDGTAGLAAIRARGGVAVVQDPEEAAYPGMPRSALETAGADHVVAARDLPALLDRLCREDVAGAARAEPAALMDAEARVARPGPDALHDPQRPGVPAGLGCPDCNGALFEVPGEGALLRYRCRVGHAWSPDSLLAQQGLELEGALWVALRTLEDKVALNVRLAQDAELRGRALTAGRFEQAAEETLRAADSIRRLIAALGASGSTAEIVG